jgi:hypothetical protein
MSAPDIPKRGTGAIRNCYHSGRMFHESISTQVSLVRRGARVVANVKYTGKRGKPGQWHGKGVLVLTSGTSVKIGDKPDHTVGVTQFDGAVFNNDGRGFLDKAHYQAVGIEDTGIANGGYKEFTEGDGSKVFAKFTTTEVKLPAINGTFEFTGGAGRYENITGRGTFHLVLVSDKAATDELTAEYRIPMGKSRQ